jgi:POT family proton-dependent oligopeptide transporter
MRTRDWQVLILLLFLIPVLAVGSIGNQELYNAYLLWADRSYDFILFGIRLPTTYLATIDAATGVTTLIGVVAFWRWYGSKWREPDEVTKIAIGCFISSTAFIILALVASHAAATGTKVSLGVALAIHTINGIGFANVFPVSLALYSRAAPRAIGATMIGIYYLFLFGANTLVGWVGGWLDEMTPMRFWGLHAGLIILAGAIFVAVKLAFGRLLQAAEEAPLPMGEALPA